LQWQLVFLFLFLILFLCCFAKREEKQRSRMRMAALCNGKPYNLFHRFLTDADPNIVLQTNCG